MGKLARMLGRFLFVPALPLLRDPAARLMPWLMAAMTFLALMSLAGGHVLGTVVARWTGEIKGAVTVQVLPLPGAAGAVPVDDPRVAAVAMALGKHDAVASVQVLSDDALFRLLEPWLGSESSMADLPLPRLIDVQLARTSVEDVAAITAKVRALVPDAAVDDHRTWMRDVVDLADALQHLARFAVGLITGITALVVVLAARSGLTAHDRVIGILHQMGASDRFISRQFAKRCLADAGSGALAGLVVLTPVLIIIQVLAGRIESGLLPPVDFDAAFWGLLVAVTAALAGLASMTTYICVHGTLRRTF